MTDEPNGLIERVLADAEERSGHVADGWYGFPQMHSDTSLGFGGMAGQMMTSAPTIIVTAGAMAYVYFGGRFGYDAPLLEAMEWVKRRRAPTRLERYRRPVIDHPDAR